MDQRIKKDKLIFLVEKKEKKDEFVKTESNLRSIRSCILIDGSNYIKKLEGFELDNANKISAGRTNRDSLVECDLIIKCYFD